MGPVGASFAHGAVGLLGLVAWGVPIELALFAAPLLRRRASIANVARLAGDVLVACIVSALLHIALTASHRVRSDAHRRDVRRAFRRGAAFALLDRRLVHHRPHRDRPDSDWPRFFLVHRLDGARRARYRSGSRQGASDGARAVAGAWAMARDLERERAEKLRRAAEPRIDSSGQDQAIIAALSEDDSDGQTATPPPLRIAETPDVAIVMTPNVASLSPRARARARPIEAAPRRKRTSTSTPTSTSTSTTTADLEPDPDRRPRPHPPTAKRDREEPSTEGRGHGHGHEYGEEEGARRRWAHDRRHIWRDGGSQGEGGRAIGCCISGCQSRDAGASADPVLEIDRELLRKNAKLLEKTLNDYGVQRQGGGDPSRPHGHDVRGVARRPAPRSPRSRRSPTISRSGFRARCASSRPSPARTASASRSRTSSACR